MAAQNPPSVMQNVATETAAQFRNMLAAAVTAQGVVGTGDLAVSQHGAGNMSVDVAVGGIWIKGTENSLQGFYHAFNDATFNIVISASDPTNPRIDTIYAKVQDAFYSGATNAWSMVVVNGTATSGANLTNLTGKGAAPNSSVVLAYVLVPATATSILTADISDQRTRAAGSDGGVLINGYAQITSSPATFSTSEVAVIGLNANVNVASGRRIRARFSGILTASVAGDIVQVIIRDGGIGGITGTLVWAGNCLISTAGQNQTFTVDAILTPSAGNHPYQITTVGLGGFTGTGQVLASSSAPAYILVEDIGAV